ncbi:ATP-binding cassette domain-containing protein [Nocardioides zeae]|uniref:ATP-binding cassette domain-containing protein n=1 Tax=Nocardioides imazamoxiresistens TaxID=3231893 RepID=A0ABU3PWA8_9ACTN|nr:ATP-binding cassette domain-containing protein [Nocardioides zeae]MDT9593516.1 ATP-binding cassette domain-containing protein [Nocardioides zeae]
MNAPIIETTALTKTFPGRRGTVEAVRSLDLRVEPGELVALLGPNGAGKSTTLRMLTTLLPPTSGAARVAGFDVVREQGDVRRHIGYVGQGNGAGSIQRGRDELLNAGRSYGMSAADTRERAAHLVDALDLGGVVDRTVQTMSGGQRRRLDIALGMIHAPALLFLDEPSTGLDPQNRAHLQEQVLDLHRAGTTVVLTTHYLDEADAMAQRVVVVDHGRVIADDTPQHLKDGLGVRVTVALTGTDEVARTLALVGDADPEAHAVEVDGRPGVALRHRDGTAYAADLVRRLGDAGVGVAGIEVVRPTLDDVFLSLTGRSLREADGQPADQPTEQPADQPAA